MSEKQIYCLKCNEVRTDGKMIFKTAFKRYPTKTIPLGVCVSCSELRSSPITSVPLARAVGSN